LNLKDRVAVITGAGSGIGRATALSLARRGCHLALADIHEAGLAQTPAPRQLGVLKRPTQPVIPGERLRFFTASPLL
jgi:NAD(P)-dependent dehydrogenase (short-subunit alcohol dehydrogenase family)